MFAALISLTCLAIVFAILLSIVHSKFAVEKSELEEKLLELVPGANCGACGFSGCDGFVSALIENKASVNACPVCAPDAREKIAKILGKEPISVVAKVAVIKCKGGKGQTYEKFDYVGINTCFSSNMFFSGPRSCPYGCIGLGDCVSVCKFNAIKIGENGIPIIDDKKCKGCGLCVSVCPKNIIEIIPKEQKLYVACSSPDNVKLKRKYCKTSCIGCGLCVKSCPYNGIELVDGVAKIDFEKCQNCGICVKKCPTGVIVDKLPGRPKAIISTSCNGCGECKKVCRLNAIDGEIGTKHKVIFESCVGCGLCEKVCKIKAITIVFSNYSEVM